MELVAEDEISYTLWVIDIGDTSNIKSINFVGVEAESVTLVLDEVYKWIDGLDYAFSSSEIIVFDLHEFGVLLGKQGEDSLWIRDFADYVSYCAGAWGMSYIDASSTLMRPIMGMEGRPRYRKMTTILLLIRKNAKTMRDFLTSAAELNDLAMDANTLLGCSGLAQEIWSKPVDDEKT